MKLTNELLQSFITTFYGSGDYAGDYWFVGMEEGGGNDLPQVSARLNAWKDLGGNELVDIFDFHNKIAYPEYFRDPVKLQWTWMQQARIVLTLKGQPATTGLVKAYQRDTIGRKGSETCLLELFPLPSPSTSDWLYAQWSELPFLRNRVSYRDYCAPWRCGHIRSQIRVHHPKIVVFFGLKYCQYWQDIAGGSLIFTEHNGYFYSKSKGPVFLIAKHPAARGVANLYFESIGLLLK